MITQVWLVAAVLIAAIALLGNELRLIIDERYDSREEPARRHAAGSLRHGAVSAVKILARQRQVAEDRELFERITRDLDLAQMNWHTEPLPMALPDVDAQVLARLSRVGG